jgi:FKBP12-rapamycin complex-associated protein
VSIPKLAILTSRKQKEESAQLLCLLIGAAASLVKSYAPTILTVLLRIAAADDTPVQVVAHCVTGIGELARVAGEELVPEVTNLLALLVNMLNDQTSAIKRNAALKTLGQIASNTGAVVQPYAQHPQLLGILFRMLRTETNQTTRLETIRTMGMLGALDPFRHKMIQGGIDDPNADTAGPRVTDITLLMNISTPSNDDYYQTVVVNSLVNVLNDSSMKELHYEAIQAVMLIFRSQQLRSVSFLPQILPAFLNVIRIASVTRQEVYLKQLANLISIVKQHVRNYLDDVFDLIHDFWNPNSKLQITIIQLVEAVARAVEGEFKAYLPRLLQQILRSFDGDLATKHIGERRLQTLLHILRAFYVFGSNIEDYLHLVLPVVVKSFENPHSPDELRKAALRTTGQLCRKVNFTDHASQIIHPLVRTLANGDHEVKNIAMDTLCVLLLQFGADYAIFIPMVNKAMAANRIIHPQYESLVTKLLNRERLPPDLGPVEQ